MFLQGNHVGGLVFTESQSSFNFKQKTHLYRCKAFPKDPAVLKILRVVNLLLVVFLVHRGDLLSRRSLCGHDFPGNYRHFSSPRRVHGVVNLGGVVKTLRRSKFTIFAIVVVFLVWKGPLGFVYHTSRAESLQSPTSPSAILSGQNGTA